MGNELLEKLVDKSITKEELKEQVENNYSLLPEIVNGMSSDKAAIRYGCGKVLMDLSEEKPEKIYPHMDHFIKLLDSKYRIITWQAMAVIANLTRVDSENKFDKIFDKYYSFLNDEYMVTVANIVGHSGKIALAKTHLIPRVKNELLKVEKIKTTPHLTEECKRVIAEGVIRSFDMFFDMVEDKDDVFLFVKKHVDSSRKSLQKGAEQFLQKWSN